MDDAINFESDAAPQEPAADSLQRLSALCATLLEEQWRAAGLDEQLISSEARIRQLSEVDIPELLKECGLSEVKLADGTKVKVAADLECAITKENRAAAFAWLREHELGGIIKTLVALEFAKGDELKARALRSMFALGLSSEAVDAIVKHATATVNATQTEPEKFEPMLAALHDVLSNPPPAILDEDVHWQTLKATLKAERAAGRDVPELTFSLRPFDKAKLELPEGVDKPPTVRKRK